MAGRRVVVEFLGQDKSLSKTADSAEKKTSRLGTTMAGVGKAAALGLAAGVVVGTVALVKMTKGAAEDEAAQKMLATTMKNTAGATDAQVASVEDYISKVGEATGVTDDEMRPALANLLRATKDVDKAQGLMGLALDVSAGTGKDLGAVTMALAKAQNGSVGGLAKLGIATKDADGKTKSFAQIQKDLAKTFAGQSAASANTLEGKMARLKLIFAETQETIGAKLLPVATKLGDWFLNKGIPAIKRFGDWFSAHVIPRLRELGQAVAAHVMPILRGLADWVASTGLPTLKKLGAWLVTTLTPVFESIAEAIGRVKVALQENEPQLRKLAAGIMVVVQWIGKHLAPVLVWVSKLIYGRLASAIVTAIKVISTLVVWIPKIANAFGSAFSAVGKAWTKFAGFVGGWKTAISRRVSSLFSSITTAFGSVWSTVSGAWTRFAGWVGGWKAAIGRRVSSLFSAITSAFGNAWSTVSGAWTRFAGWVGGWKASITARVSSIFSAITTAFGSAWTAVSGSWGRFVAWVGGWKTSVTTRVSSLFSAVGTAFSNAWTTVSGAWTQFATWVGRWKTALSFSGMFNGIAAAFKSAINAVIGGWNRLSFSLPSVDTHIPGIGRVGGWTIHTPDIPLLAQGGDVTSPGLAVVGERGPELLSLQRGARVTPLPAGGGTTNIYINGALDPVAVGKQVQKILLNLKRTNGGLALGLG